MKRGLLFAAAVAAVFFPAAANAAPTDSVEVVVTLDAPPLAQAIQREPSAERARQGRSGSTCARRRASATSRSLATAQRTLAARITTTIPGARVTWRYQVVLDGLAVLVPRTQLGRLVLRRRASRRSGRASPTGRCSTAAPKLIGADQLWGAPLFDTAGNGIKIGIIDDGVDQAHPFFNPSGYTMPPGFPKGNTTYTTAKVIVARAFSPPTNTWKYAKHALRPDRVGACDARRRDRGRRLLAGRDPRPRPALGRRAERLSRQLQGADRPDRELRAERERARDRRRRSRRPSATAWTSSTCRSASRRSSRPATSSSRRSTPPPTPASSRRSRPGTTSTTSATGASPRPGSAAKAITVAAVSKQLAVASFSSGGPTPISLELKPDVSRPGRRHHLVRAAAARARGRRSAGRAWPRRTSPAAAALLRQRHPDWTVAQVKSALVLTGKPTSSSAARLPTTREGGGLIDLAGRERPADLRRARRPLVRPAAHGHERDASVDADRRGRRRGPVDGLARTPDRPSAGDRHRPGHGDRPRTTRRDGHAPAQPRRDVDRLRRPHARHRHAAHPVLVPRRRPEARRASRTAR